MAKKCEMSHCSEQAYAVGLCTACYAYVRYWHVQGLARAHKHSAKLTLRQERLDSLRPTNVVSLRKRA